jgi:hypothetical protein
MAKTPMTVELPGELVDAIDRYIATDWRDGCDPSRFGALNAVAFIGEQLVAAYVRQRQVGA